MVTNSASTQSWFCRHVVFSSKRWKYCGLEIFFSAVGMFQEGEGKPRDKLMEKLL